VLGKMLESEREETTEVCRILNRRNFLMCTVGSLFGGMLKKKESWLYTAVMKNVEH